MPVPALQTQIQHEFPGGTERAGRETDALEIVAFAVAGNPPRAGTDGGPETADHQLRQVLITDCRRRSFCNHTFSSVMQPSCHAYVIASGDPVA